MTRPYQFKLVGSICDDSISVSARAQRLRACLRLALARKSTRSDLMFDPQRLIDTTAKM